MDVHGGVVHGGVVEEYSQPTNVDLLWGDMDHSPSDGVGQAPHQTVEDVVWHRSSIKISHHGLNHPWVSVMLCAGRVPVEPVLTTATACGTAVGTAVESSLGSAGLPQWSQTQAYTSNV